MAKQPEMWFDKRARESKVPETKASTDGLTRFIIKVAGKQGRGRHWTPIWLFVTQICEAENYRVKKFQWGANRDRAQRMGKLQAEQMAESIRKGHRIQAVVEPEVME